MREICGRQVQAVASLFVPAAVRTSLEDPVTNERLRGSVNAAGYSLTEFAAKIGVVPKTAERWITQDRVPRPRLRSLTCGLLQVDELYLWPDLADDPRTQSASRAELIEFFPARSTVPVDLWGRLVGRADECCDLLAYAASFLPEHVDIVPRLIDRARRGVRIRVLLGDPQSAAVALRGEEEGFGDGVAHRIQLSLHYFQEALVVPGFELRLHATTLYASLFRADSAVLANIHVFGSPASQSPVLHLQRIPGGRVFDHYMRSFDRVWDSAKPIPDVHALIKITKGRQA